MRAIHGSDDSLVGISVSKSVYEQQKFLECFNMESFDTGQGEKMLQWYYDEDLPWWAHHCRCQDHCHFQYPCLTQQVSFCRMHFFRWSNGSKYIRILTAITSGCLEAKRAEGSTLSHTTVSRAMHACQPLQHFLWCREVVVVGKVLCFLTLGIVFHLWSVLPPLFSPGHLTEWLFLKKSLFFFLCSFLHLLNELYSLIFILVILGWDCGQMNFFPQNFMC